MNNKNYKDYLLYKTLNMHKINDPALKTTTANFDFKYNSPEKLEQIIQTVQRDRLIRKVSGNHKNNTKLTNKKNNIPQNFRKYNEQDTENEIEKINPSLNKILKQQYNVRLLNDNEIKTIVSNAVQKAMKAAIKKSNEFVEDLVTLESFNMLEENIKKAIRHQNQKILENNKLRNKNKAKKGKRHYKLNQLDSEEQEMLKLNLEEQEDKEEDLDSDVKMYDEYLNNNLTFNYNTTNKSPTIKCKHKLSSENKEKDSNKSENITEKLPTFKTLYSPTKSMNENLKQIENPDFSEEIVDSSENERNDGKSEISNLEPNSNYFSRIAKYVDSDENEELSSRSNVKAEATASACHSEIRSSSTTSSKGNSSSRSSSSTSSEHENNDNGEDGNNPENQITEKNSNKNDATEMKLIFNKNEFLADSEFDSEIEEETKDGENNLKSENHQNYNESISEITESSSQIKTESISQSTLNSNNQSSEATTESTNQTEDIISENTESILDLKYNSNERKSEENIFEELNGENKKVEKDRATQRLLENKGPGLSSLEREELRNLLGIKEMILTDDIDGSESSSSESNENENELCNDESYNEEEISNNFIRVEKTNSNRNPKKSSKNDEINSEQSVKTQSFKNSKFSGSEVSLDFTINDNSSIKIDEFLDEIKSFSITTKESARTNSTLIESEESSLRRISSRNVKSSRAFTNLQKMNSSHYLDLPITREEIEEKLPSTLNFLENPSTVISLKSPEIRNEFSPNEITHYRNQSKKPTSKTKSLRQKNSTSNKSHSEITSEPSSRRSSRNLNQISYRSSTATTSSCRTPRLLKLEANQPTIILSKTTSYQQDVIKTLSQIREKIEAVSLPEDLYDKNRREKRIIEFSTRFTRQYLYQIERMIEDIRVTPKEVLLSNRNDYQIKICTLYGTIQQALQAYMKQINCFIPNLSSKSLIMILNCIIYGTKICKHKRVFAKTDAVVVKLINICNELVQYLEDLLEQEKLKENLKQNKANYKKKPFLSKWNLSKTNKLSMYDTSAYNYTIKNNRSKKNINLTNINEVRKRVPPARPNSEIKLSEQKSLENKSLKEKINKSRASSSHSSEVVSHRGKRRREKLTTVIEDLPLNDSQIYLSANESHNEDGGYDDVNKCSETEITKMLDTYIKQKGNNKDIVEFLLSKLKENTTSDGVNKKITTAVVNNNIQIDEDDDDDPINLKVNTNSSAHSLNDIITTNKNKMNNNQEKQKEEQQNYENTNIGTISITENITEKINNFNNDEQQYKLNQPQSPQLLKQNSNEFYVHDSLYENQQNAKAKNENNKNSNDNNELPPQLFTISTNTNNTNVVNRIEKLTKLEPTSSKSKQNQNNDDNDDDIDDIDDGGMIINVVKSILSNISNTNDSSSSKQLEEIVKIIMKKSVTDEQLTEMKKYQEKYQEHINNAFNAEDGGDDGDDGGDDSGGCGGSGDADSNTSFKQREIEELRYKDNIHYTFIKSLKEKPEENDDIEIVSNDIQFDNVSETFKESLNKNNDNQRKLLHSNKNNYNSTRSQLINMIKNDRRNFIKKISNDPMYVNEHFSEPWKVIERISDRIVTEVIEDIGTKNLGERKFINDFLNVEFLY